MAKRNGRATSGTPAGRKRSARPVLVVRAVPQVEEMNKSGPVKVAMIGLGWWGKKMTAVLKKATDRQGGGGLRFRCRSAQSRWLLFGAGLDGGCGLFLGQGQRLFAENVLSRGNGALDLFGVQRAAWQG